VSSAGAAGLVAGLAVIGAVSLAGQAGWWTVLAIWFLLGLSYSAVLTPSGRLIKRSSHEEDRPALFAAQFALSHACWLLTYPLAGWMGAALGMSWTFLALAAITSAGTAAAFLLWRVNDPSVCLTSTRNCRPAIPMSAVRRRPATASNMRIFWSSTSIITTGPVRRK
jgi:Na+/melibiose symporter-like transporter